MRNWLAGIVAGMMVAGSVAAQDITAARFADPTDRYDHAILGDNLEWATLLIEVADGRNLRLSLPETRVFEDLAPRLVDLDGDGLREVVVVESDLALGARLSVYGPLGLIAATSFYGRPHRWLAPVGFADLDGDGRTEIAFIDRPHLAKTLIILRLEGDALVKVAAAPDLSNHRIGESRIGGGIRDCGTGPEVITANGTWTRLMATRFEAGKLVSRDIGAFSGDYSGALSCP
jgi:hypothetical protein